MDTPHRCCSRDRSRSSNRLRHPVCNMALHSLLCPAVCKLQRSTNDTCSGHRPLNTSVDDAPGGADAGGGSGTASFDISGFPVRFGACRCLKAPRRRPPTFSLSSAAFQVPVPRDAYGFKNEARNSVIAEIAAPRRNRGQHFHWGPRV
eukprot:7378563-Prymnesium_polylepis.2